MAGMLMLSYEVFVFVVVQEVVDQVTGSMVGVIKRLTIALAENNLDEIASVMAIFEAKFAPKDRSFMFGAQHGMVMDGAFAQMKAAREAREKIMIRQSMELLD